MKLVVLQKDLVSALSRVSKFTTNRAQLPILGNIVFRASKNKLELLATNLEMSIITSVGAKVSNEGEIAVPSKIINDLVSGFDSEQIELTLDKETLVVESGAASSTLMCMNSADFPQIPQKLSKNATTLSLTDLQRSLEKTIFAISIDETRPILTGALFSFSKTSLNIVATDGFRLSSCQLKTQSKAYDIVVPKGILNELLRAQSTTINLDYSSDDNQIVFEIGGSIYSSRVINGEFPNYKKIIPTSSDLELTVDSVDLLKAVKFVSVIARDASNVIRIVIGKNSIELKSENKSSGRNKIDVECRVEGNIDINNPLEIAFNYKYLEDILNCVESDSVKIGLTSNDEAGVFTDPMNKSSFHLVMPVKI